MGDCARRQKKTQTQQTERERENEDDDRIILTSQMKFTTHCLIHSLYFSFR